MEWQFGNIRSTSIQTHETEILNMGSISTKKHEMEIGNMESISSPKTFNGPKRVKVILFSIKRS